MALKIKPQSPLTRQDKFSEEKEFLLMKYQGIFKNNIKEYAERVIPRVRNKKNYAK
jgi:hypothetical protein